MLSSKMVVLSVLGCICSVAFQPILVSAESIEESTSFEESLGYRHAPYYVPGTLIWSDEFDGIELDPYYWTHDLGGGGWGNFEKQAYTYNSVQVADGNLQITAKQTGSQGEYHSGRINTQGGIAFKYGKLEARIKMPDLERGLWPAFWLMGIKYGPHAWPSPGEIDIVEMGKGDWGNMINHRVLSAAHWEHEGDYAIHDKFRESIFEYTGRWNTYTLDWTEDYIRTYIGDAMIWEHDLDPDMCSDCEEFHDFHFMLLNMAIGGRFTYVNGEEAPITATLPATMQVDYVRLYANPHTEVLMRAVPSLEEIVAEPSASPSISMEPSSAPSCSGKSASCKSKGKGRKGRKPNKKKRDGSANGLDGEQSISSQLRSSSPPSADYSHTLYFAWMGFTTIIVMACTTYY